MIIYNAKIYPMSGKPPFKGWIEFDEKITKIGEGEYPQSQYSSNGTTTKTVNAGGKILLPGFIDAHTHLGIVEGGISFEGDDCNESTDPFTPHLRVIDGINPFDRYFKEALLQGITTVAVAPGSANVCGGDIIAIKTKGSFVDEMLIKQVGVKFALGENPKSTYNDRNETPITRPAMTAIIREGLNKAKRYLESIEKYNANPEENDLPEYDAKCEGLLPLLRGEVPAHFHAHRADDICTAIRICREFNLKLVLIHATEGYLIGDIIRKAGYFNKELKKLGRAFENVFGNAFGSVFGSGENSQNLEKGCVVGVVTGPLLCDCSKPELSNQDLRNTAVLFEKWAENLGKTVDIPVAICTDHPETPIGFLPVTVGAAMRGGLDFENALRSVTINSAKILGIDSRVGSIEVGKDADFQLYYSDNIFEILSKPIAVYLQGKVVN